MLSNLVISFSIFTFSESLLCAKYSRSDSEVTPVSIHIVFVYLTDVYVPLENSMLSLRKTSLLSVQGCKLKVNARLLRLLSSNASSLPTYYEKGPQVCGLIPCSIKTKLYFTTSKPGVNIKKKLIRTRVPIIFVRLKHIQKSFL